MPRFITKPIVISGANSCEELQSLMMFTDQDEMIIAYVESCFLDRQAILDSISTLGMKCYVNLKEFLDFHHDNGLIATGLILALEACNYHDAVRWIEESYPRSSHMDYNRLNECRKTVERMKLHLTMFDQHLTKLEMKLTNSNPEEFKVSTDNLTPLDQYIQILVEAWAELESAVDILTAIEDEDYDTLYPYMQSVVEPELTNPKAKELTDDPEVSEFMESVATGELSYVDFCSRHGLAHDNQVALAKFIDENGY